MLSETMNLDSMAADIGFDMRLDAVFARAKQLTKLEGQALTENKILARNLQRKVGKAERVLRISPVIGESQHCVW